MNPLTRRQANQSHTPPADEETLVNRTAVSDDAVTPIVDRYLGVNNPYRGNNTHGVNAPVEYHYLPEFTGHEGDGGYDPAAHEPDPIAVRIVESKHAKEFRDFRVMRTQVTAGVGVRIVGRDESRTKVTIVNMTNTFPVYVGSESSVAPYIGFPVAATPLVLSNQSDVWAICDVGATPQELAIAIEYNIGE